MLALVAWLFVALVWPDVATVIGSAVVTLHLVARMLNQWAERIKRQNEAE